MNSTASNLKLNMNDTVTLAVIIEGTFEGVSQGSTQLQSLIATYVANNDVDDFDEEWILDNVLTYPLLSTEPMQLTYDVTQELDITFDESDYRVEERYYIEDIDTEFDSQQELEDWIAESIADFDYTTEQVKTWDIKKRTETAVTVEIEGDDEYDITAYGARATVSQFIEVPEPTPPSVMDVTTDIDFTTLDDAQLQAIIEEVGDIITARDKSLEVEGDDTTDIEVALGHPDTIERGAKVWALSAYYANARLKADKPVYLIDDVGRGVRTESLEAIREHVRQGGMVGRLWSDNDWEATV